MTIKQSTRLLVAIQEDLINLAFFSAIAMRIMETIPVMGWLYMSSAMQKTLKFILGAII